MNVAMGGKLPPLGGGSRLSYYAGNNLQIVSLIYRSNRDYQLHQWPDQIAITGHLNSHYLAVF